MSPRALAAAAVLTATLAGPVAGQSPPGMARIGGEPAPLAPAMPPGMAPGSPYLGGNPMVMPGAVPVAGRVDPVSPVEPSPAAPPVYSDAVLPTDGLFVGPGGPRGPQCWIAADYLLFWTRHAPVSVPLATVGPATSLGIIGQPNVRTILGNDEFSFQTFSGVRVSGGWWFTENQSVGIESSLFILPEKSSNTPSITGTDILPTLARPFYDTALNRQNSRLLTRPGAFAGGIQSELTSELWGAEVLPVWRFFDQGGWMTMDLLGGFKFLSLEESITINDFATALAGGVANFNGQAFRAPAVTYVQDRVATQNRFYGFTSGLRVNAHYEAFTLGVTGKVAVGNVRQQIRVDGSTTLAGIGPGPQTTGGGFYTTGFNAGKYTHDEFAVLPELGVNLTVQVTNRILVNIGYSGLYLSEAVRPGEQLSTNINNTQIPTGQNFGARFGTPTLPPQFVSNAYWAQGFNFGLGIGF